MSTCLPRPPANGADDDGSQLVSLQTAASAVGVSSSTLRRWADDGRLPSVRTAGGHRRFPLAGVRRLAGDRHPKAIVLPVEPPTRPLAALAGLLRARGGDLLAGASAALYRDGHAGVFGRDDQTGASADWLAQVARACETGRYGAAQTATDVFMRGVSVLGTPLLERYRFLDHLAETTARALTGDGASQRDLRAARRLFASLQQAHLAGRP